MAENQKPLDHLGIIMDGNGRWAEKRHLPRTAGHIAGAKRIEPLLVACRKMNIRHVTLYAFSTENWRRPKDEVDTIMDLIYYYLSETVMKKIEEDDSFSIRFLGDKSPLPEKLRELCLEVEKESAEHPFVCNVALNYGGRTEIVHAVNAALADGHKEITEELISRYTYTYPSPDPDLVIRTGGEHRTSNFLLWQSAYSEYVITDTLFPDFDEDALEKAVAEYRGRKRRFGGLNPKE